MTSLTRRYGVWFALGAALVASACQRDSDANFDDSRLMPPAAGGSGASDTGGADAAAGLDAGGTASGGTDASAGEASDGGTASAGTSGSPAVGGQAGSSNGGTSTGGTAAQGGKAGMGGKAGVGAAAGSATAGAGMGGTVGTPPPVPVTFETTAIDDTYVASCLQSMNFGALSSMNVDGNSSCTYQILISVPLSDIPAGALVSDATLTLTCTNAGDPITVSYVNEPWKELMVRYNTRPEVGASLGTVTCQQPGEEVTINLTSAVKAWLAGNHAANGIYLRTEDSDGTDFDTSEAHTTSTRPVFRVTYALPVK